MTPDEYNAFLQLVQRAGMNQIEAAFARRVLGEIRALIVEETPPTEEKPMSDNQGCET
jgi:hypothetical protein